MQDESPVENRPITPGAALATAGLCLAFGANAVAIRVSTAAFGPLTLAGLRFALAALVIAAWARLARESLVVRGPRLRAMLTLSLAFTVQIALFYVGVDRSLASRSTLVANVQPFLVLLLAHFLLPDERITLRRVVGMALGFGGVVALFSDTSAVAATVRTGDLIILAAVVLWSATTVWLKRIIHDYSAFQVAFYPMLVTAPCLLLAGLAWDHPAAGFPPAAALAGLAYQTFVTAAVGFVAWNTLFRRHGAVAMNSYLFLQPVAGVALGGLLLGEPVATYGVLLGLPLVVLGIVVVNRKAPAPRPASFGA